MSLWILIILFNGYKAGGLATATFHSRDACVTACVQVREQLPIKCFCVEDKK